MNVRDSNTKHIRANALQRPTNMDIIAACAHPQLLPLSNLLHAKARERGGASLQHLYVVVVAVAHDDAPLAVNCNAVGIAELPISSTIAATKGSNVAAVAVSQNLHPMITEVGNNDVAGTVKRDANGIVELPCA